MTKQCPSCKEEVPYPTGKIGRPNTCGKCKDAFRLGRNARAAERRRNGLVNAHYNKEGIRYELSKIPEKLHVCHYCNKEFYTRNAVETDFPVCKSCGPIHKFEQGKKSFDRRVASSYTPEELLKKRLQAHGVTQEWYDSQPKNCGICGTTEAPKSKNEVRSWHIDHDHSCCSSNRSCSKCVRGLLCDRCNLGLGCFRDNPESLRKAIEWVTKVKG